MAEHPELTLDKAIIIAWQGEILKKQQAMVRIQQHDAVSVKNVDPTNQTHLRSSTLYTDHTPSRTHPFTKS